MFRFSVQPRKSLILLLGFLLFVFACDLPSRTTSETSITSTPEIAQVPTTVTTASAPQPTALLATPIPPASDTPPPEVKLEVGSYSIYPNSLGGLYVVGEVLNKGNTPVWQVQVVVTFLDSNKNVLATEGTNLAGLSVVAAGGKYPFLLLIDNNPGTYKEIQFQVQGEPYEGSTIFTPYLDLRTEGMTIAKSVFGSYSVSGRVVNTGKQTATLVHIVATAYDAKGKVIDVADSYAKLDQIKAGGNAPFQVDFSNIKTAPPKYEVYAQGRVGP